MKTHEYEKMYVIEMDGDQPVSMTAKGLNAVRVTRENIGEEAGFLHLLMTGGCPGSDFFIYHFVIFKGKSIGKNYVGDGEVVIPMELIKVYTSQEMRGILGLGG